MSMRNGWKVGEPYFVSKQAAYVERVVKELLEARKNDPKRPATTDQAPSTMHLLAMTEEELEVYRNRPMPENWLANPDAETNDESVGMRTFDPAEVSHVESLRRKAKNQVGDAWAEGESGFTKEKRQLAQDAFTFSPPAQLTPHELERVSEPKAIVSQLLPRSEESKTRKNWWYKIWYFWRNDDLGA
jgi:hypothetical protein